MATLLRSEHDIIKSRQSLDDFRRLLSLLAEDDCIVIVEDEEDANVELGDGRVVTPAFGTQETRPSGEPDEQAENNETEEQHLVSVEPSSPFVSPATEAERVAAEADAGASEEDNDPAPNPNGEGEGTEPGGDAEQS